MKTALRIVAVVFGVNGLFVTLIGVYALAQVVQQGLPPVGGYRLIYIVLGPLGVFGAIQLLRLRETGRRASLAFMGITFLLSLVSGLGSANAVDLSIGALLGYAFEIGCLLLLLSQGARDLCNRSLTALAPSAETGAGPSAPPSNTEVGGR